MDPAEQTAIFALIAVLFFMVSLFADDERWWLSVGCTGVLVCYWALNTILWMMSVVEDLSLPSDLLFAVGSLALTRSLRKPWLAVLSALFLANLLLDVLHLTRMIDYSLWAQAGNVTFVLQLGAASFPGLMGLTRILISRPNRV